MRQMPCYPSFSWVIWPISLLNDARANSIISLLSKRLAGFPFWPGTCTSMGKEMAGALSQSRRCGQARDECRSRTAVETVRGWCQVAAILRNTGFVLAGLLLLVLPAAGQLTLGDLSSNLNGVLSAGYNGIMETRSPPIIAWASAARARFPVFTTIPTSSPSRSRPT
jgi:hypothetical protein